ncbi:hypothetical protein K0U83_05945 [bacterium]|jgi:hypothetical protein|nr:hypothetical protein [bacterium]HRB02161.1 hypothetical protein [Ilumatobacteraceae bacterium]
MSWQQWVLAVYFGLGALTTVGTIGKPRKPIDPDTAVGMVICYVGLIALVVTG